LHPSSLLRLVTLCYLRSSNFAEEFRLVGRLVDDGHVRNKAVAASGKSFDVARVVGLVA
jgi:hypothetical protein